jgi:uncharacterized protein (UPF0332 family)
MNGEDFIAFAGRIAAGAKGGAADFRSAVSRAYYGAYHLAVDFLISTGANPPADHGEIQRMLYRTGNANARMASRFLGDLQSHRVKADYHLHQKSVETAAFAMQCVEQARDIQSELVAARPT